MCSFQSEQVIKVWL